MCVRVCACECVFCLFTLFLSILFVFQEPSFIASNNHMTFAGEYFLKRKDIVRSKFLISVNYSFNHLM